MKLVKPIIVLVLICIISAGLLGATYTATADTIAQVQKEASDKAMTEVLPGAASFTEIQRGENAGLDALRDTVAQTKCGLLMAAKEDSGAGYAFKVQDKGFGGAYAVMVGIDAQGKITGVKLLDNSETPGLGSKTGEKNFTDRFTGVDGSSLEGVQTITGATISSNAFKRCVATAFEAFAAVGEGA